MSDLTSTWFESDVLLATEKNSKVVVKPTTAVEPSINNDSVAIAIFTENTVVDYLIAIAIHATDVDIANLSTG